MNEINHTEIEDKIKKSVSDAIFAAQKASPKLTQTEIASSIDVTQAYISDITKGKKTISLKNAVLLADYLGISLDELVRGNHKGNTDTSCSGICQTLTDLFMAYKLRVEEITVSELQPIDVHDDVAWDYPEDWAKQNISYPAIYFSPFTCNSTLNYVESSAINKILDDMKKYQDLRDNFLLEDNILSPILDGRVKEIRNNLVSCKSEQSLGNHPTFSETEQSLDTKPTFNAPPATENK